MLFWKDRIYLLVNKGDIFNDIDMLLCELYYYDIVSTNGSLQYITNGRQIVY